MPERARMVCTALIGAAIGWLSYEIVYFLNPFEPRAPLSWVIAYTIGIARQHGLHRWLTFSSRASYWPSLGRAYLMYAGTAVAGTLLNGLLTGMFGLHHRLAWLLCLFTTALLSLVFLKRFVFAGAVEPR
jgi:putative flippase GtrA